LDSNSSAQLVSGSRILTRDLAERSPQSAAPMAGGDILRAGVNRVPPITPIGEGVGGIRPKKRKYYRIFKADFAI